jgi:ribosomal protein S27AE
MSQREATVSRVVEYETAECIHCGHDVFVDNDEENLDDLPEAVNVVIGGGEHISAEKSNKPRADYRIPKIIVKVFTSDDKDTMMQQQYMCPSCAKSVYGFEED